MGNIYANIGKNIQRRNYGGYKYGDSGKLYKGKNAKLKALKQMRAMFSNGYKGDKK